MVQSSSDIENNKERLLENLHQPSDFATRAITFQGKRGLLLYLESVSDTVKIQKSILTPLSSNEKATIEETVTSAKVGVYTNINEAATRLLKGDCLLLIEGDCSIYAASAESEVSRAPEEPFNEKVVRGSHDGFVENMNQNIGMIRNRIEDTDLVFKQFSVGKKTKTKVVLAYMDSVVNKDILQEVERRIESIAIDMIVSPGFMVEFLENKSFSPFPQFLPTERPDRAAAHIMDGRIALLSEGTATSLILPVTFIAFFQSPDDFNSRILSGSFFRLLRMLSFLVATTLPAIYIAIIGFHFEILPNELVLPIKASLEGIPFPPIVEAFIMVFTIELIREAGVRLPTPIGQTIGIVGGLVIGDAVVNAGFISNVMVIVIAITAVASFTVPTYEMGASIRLLTFPLMIAASLLGFLGIVMGMMIILLHLCKLESFGTPYFSPFAPIDLQGLKDSIIRFPIWKMNHRPRDVQPKDTDQQQRTRGWAKRAPKKRR
ncbi:GerA spore germination protein [Fictibacillus macauensis ZFHKF-1]|uniref:GerA spore germination protein n=1 Tax=Fictibacillus macauensis ZFHKF-1 TaxID=1196324 RepID=I8AN08_9BACL|nr:spore germination protein [Fictibacillus macauensis]EIT87099.1 GerA spore germination protein [Fictibacillus macauensis ZFHKF-1]